MEHDACPEGHDSIICRANVQGGLEGETGLKEYRGEIGLTCVTGHTPLESVVQGK